MAAIWNLGIDKKKLDNAWIHVMESTLLWDHIRPEDLIKIRHSFKTCFLGTTYLQSGWIRVSTRQNDYVYTFVE
jgi:hypothetical protein